MAMAVADGAQSGLRGDPRDQLAVPLLLGGCLNGLLVRISEAWQTHGLESPLMGISPFEFLAMVIGARAILTAPSSMKSPLLWPEAALCLAMLVPSSAFSWLAVLAYAVLEAWRAESGRRNGFLLFAALAVCSLWSSVLLKRIAGPVAALDAHLVWGMLSPLRPDISVTGNVVGVSDGHNLIIMTACTSASLMPKALLGLAALTMLAGGATWQRLQFAVFAVATTCIGINLLRLSLMAWSGDVYGFIHGPVGANTFDAAQMLAVAACGLRAVRA